MRSLAGGTVLLAAIAACACACSGPVPALAGANDEHATAPASDAVAAPAAAQAEAQPRRPPAPSRGLPDGLVPDLGGCPDSGPGRSAERAAQAALPVPLKTGLILSSVWATNEEDYDHECLTQVDGVYRDAIDVTTDCQIGPDRHMFTKTRELCRADLRQAYMYMPSNMKNVSDIVTGETMFSLSERSFRELKTQGRTRHRFVQFSLGWPRRRPALGNDRDMVLVRASTSVEPYAVTINDSRVELPVVRAVGEGAAAHGVHIVVLDQDRFPLVLEYGADDGFSIKYSTISFPMPHGIEQRLARDKHVDVYGIYFAFGSDRLRPESEPILKEIATALTRNPDWRLAINGHTDNVGGDASNMALSERRAAAVRRALADRYAIDAARLTTSGFGASQPKDRNDTPEGRAHNRRVELVRQ